MTTQTNMEQLVQEYFEVDTQMKLLDARKKQLNQTLKTYMRENSLKEFNANGIRLVFGVQNRTDMNEEKLLRRLHELGLNTAIKMVEVPDQVEIENLLYNGQLSPDTLADCTVTKTIETLTVKEKK